MELTREYLLWLFHYDRENGKRHYLDSFKTELEAHQRYMQELKARGLA